MNIKKLIASVVIALGAWISIGVAQADTNYNFSTTINTLPYTATFTSSIQGYLDGISAASFNGSDVLAYVVPTYPNPPIFGTYSGSGAGASLSGIGLYFYDASFINTYGIYGGPDQEYAPTLSLPSLLYTFVSFPPDAALTSYTFTESGGIAPEMNVSMIPQVGLLLACLFFLFGRKKENAEVMLAA